MNDTHPNPVTIRTFAGTDLPELVQIWNRTMAADPVSEQRLLLDFILAPHFDPAGLVVATHGDRLVGFVLGLSARSGQPTDNAVGTGVIVGMGVDRPFRLRGIGRQLLEHLGAHFSDRGVGAIQVGPWVPTYLTPGADQDAYPDAVPFFTASGYEPGGHPVSMRALLTGYVPAAGIDDIANKLGRDGIEIRPANVADTLPLLAFAREHFPHWESYVRGNLRALVAANDASTLQIALHNGDVIGFALTNGERFGPFGVNEAYRGQGVGAVLLSRALCAMRARNFHTAWFLWTSDQTARLYGRHGFEIVRRFTMLRKDLQGREQ